MKGNLIGLDMGDTSVKVASVKREGDTFNLEAIAQMASAQKGVSSDSKNDIEAMANVVKQLIVSSNIKTKDVALCLPENEVYTKIIEMPQLSQAELSAALKFEMEQYIPLPIDKVKTDWQILGNNDSEGKKSMNVMLVAAPIILLEKYQNIIDLANLTVDTIETEIVSVHRALLPILSTADSNMIVHIGSVATTIAVVRGGIIRMVFSINQGGASLTRSISIELGIDMQQAESYKKMYGFSPNQLEGKIAKVLQSPVASVIVDIKKAILSFREKYNNENIKQIILSGGTAMLPGLGEVMSASLGTPVSLGNSFAVYNMGNVPPELAAQGPAYNVVVGLGLRNLL